MNILIVGLGSIARKHIAILYRLEQYLSLYALRLSNNSEDVEGVINIYSLKEIQDVPIDYAIISNPTAKHQETIESLLALRCPLFIEKPLFHTLAIENTVRKVEGLRILTYVACNLRFLDCIRFVKKELEQKREKVNEVNVYCGSYLPDWRPKVDFREIYSVSPELGGGVQLDLIHELDYLYWLFEIPQKVHLVLRHSSSLQIEASDYANYCLEYESFCANVILNYFRRDPKRLLEIVFEDETWEVDLLKNRVIRVDGETLFASTQTIADTYELQLQYFMDLVKTNRKQSFNAVKDAYEVLKICIGNDTKR